MMMGQFLPAFFNYIKTLCFYIQEKPFLFFFFLAQAAWEKWSVAWTALLSDPAHAHWLKIRVLTAEFNIKVSPQQRYSLKWNHAVWSESKLNFPWCPAWQEALSGEWRSQAFSKQFTFSTKAGIVLRSCHCVFIVYLPFCTLFTLKGVAECGMLQTDLGSVILKGSGKKRLRDHKKNNTFILKLDTKAVPDGTQWVGHTLWNYVQVQVQPALSEVAAWRL